MAPWWRLVCAVPFLGGMELLGQSNRNKLMCEVWLIVRAVIMTTLRLISGPVVMESQILHILRTPLVSLGIARDFGVFARDQLPFEAVGAVHSIPAVSGPDSVAVRRGVGLIIAGT